MMAFGAPGMVAAQEVPLWALAQHDRDQAIAQEEIADATSQGLLPVGLHVAAGNILVLYSLNMGTPVQEVLLYLFDDPSTQEGEMNTLVERGLVPMDISQTAEGLYALLIDDGFSVSGWQIVTMPFNLTNIEQVQSALTQRGLSPWGVSVNDDTAYILALDEDDDVDPRTTTVLAHRFHVDSYFPAINAAVQERNFYPWGLTVADNQLLVQYIRNN